MQEKNRKFVNAKSIKKCIKMSATRARRASNVRNQLVRKMNVCITEKEMPSELEMDG